LAAKVSILIPVYNEEDLVPEVLTRVLAVSLGEDVETEIIAVDDGSADGSAAVLEEFAARYPRKIRVVRHNQNQGKGAAIRTAIEHATGDFGVIQDSDLEYNPQDLPAVLRPLLEGRADAVYGSRFATAGERRVLYYWHSIANHWLTTLCNMVADLNLTDMETGYKAFRLSLVKSIPLRSKRFGMEPELTVKLAQRGASVYEVPISYYGRTYAEGKKIGFKDAVQALFVILSYGIRRDIYLDYGARILDALAQTPRFNAWMADTVRPYMGSHVLEIGSGIGNLAQYLSPRRKSYVASDIEEEHLSRLWVRFQNRPNMRLIRCDLSNPRDFSELKERFDTVVCLNVLEHIEDDSTGLRNIASALAPGGTAIILVPQGMAIYGTLDEVLGHYRRYSEKELVSKMEGAGFEVEQVLHFNRVTRPGWWFNGQILRRRYFSRFQLWAFDRLVWFWKRIDRGLPWPAVSIIAIGRKR
jgi:2-polyprenyl-3-methyl-5-hydroxy-6-metoxy-1,4-benzoquinol methylase